MSNPQLFVVGLAVTILMCAALAPLIWAAILDGRYNDQQQRLYRGDLIPPVSTTAAVAEPAAVSHVS
ncbi:MAG: hypothetical protein ACR2IK_06275 [Chloroflexota bacterium]